MKNEQGFSLIELLITIAISTSILVISLPLYNNLQSSTKLDESVSQTIDFLRAGREQSRAGLRSANFGVYFNPVANRVVLYQGTSYALHNATYDQVLDLEGEVKIVTSIPGNDINFAKSTGFASITGQVDFTFSRKQRSVAINKYGISLEMAP